jgi:hypothetical protein
VRFWRILLLQQETVEVLNELSQVYLALGQESEARPLLERSLALSPDQDGVRSALARLQ